MLSKDGTVHDKAIVSFDEGTLLGKYFFNETHAKLYIPQGSEDYAIAFSEKTGEMPLNFKATKSGEYTLSFNTEGVKLAYLHLIDNLTGADVNLLQTPEYTFDAKTNDYASRFRLVFSTEDAGGTPADQFAYIDANGNIIITEGDACNASLQVVDVMGRVIRCRDAVPASMPTTGMTPGIYILRLINGDSIRTQKIVVK
jgi:hypothetical protein